MDTTRIARVAYDARKAFALTQGDGAHPEWFKLDGWQRTAMVHQVKTIVINKGVEAPQLHALFLRERSEAGWKHGARFDIALKRDPMVVPWEHLTPELQKADELVIAVVRVFQAQAV